jgi:hypothetical protein
MIIFLFFMVVILTLSFLVLPVMLLFAPSLSFGLVSHMSHVLLLIVILTLEKLFRQVFLVIEPFVISLFILLNFDLVSLPLFCSAWMDDILLFIDKHIFEAPYLL